MTVITGWWFI